MIAISDVLLTNLSVIAGLMLVVWLISLPLRNVSIVDIVWGAGFVLIAWVTVAVTTGSGPSRWLLPVMTSLWGLRLSGYLAWRNIGKGEDKRYAAMRSKRSPQFAFTSLIMVFALQGAVMWIVSLPLQTGIAFAQSGWTWLHGLGIALWSVGLLFESIGDLQLARFKANPNNAGMVMNRGLWRYTRHPNYFGDFLVWWGLYATAIAHTTAIWTIIGPSVMTLFLMRVSGVSLLEQSLQQTRPGYAEYACETNAFFPWFPAERADL